jgi:hypothetical protein
VIAEWDVPFFLQPSDGSLPPLPINQQVMDGSSELGFFLLDPARCSAGAARRITRNNIAQADGEITHRKFKTGYVVELNMQLWERAGVGGQVACGGTLRRMADLLDEYLEAIANNDGQLVWQPSAYPVGGSAPNERMLDQARSMGPSGSGSAGASFVSIVTEKDPESPLLVVTFALLSPLPYAIDEPLETTDITAGATVTNPGNAAYFPVLRASNLGFLGSSITGFTVTNESVTDENGVPLALVFDSTLPGGEPLLSGEWEFDMFLNTATIATATPPTDVRADIDARQTDFWPLAPGANTITVSGVTGDGTLQLLLDWRAAWI